MSEAPERKTESSENRTAARGPTGQMAYAPKCLAAASSAALSGLRATTHRSYEMVNVHRRTNSFQTAKPSALPTRNNSRLLAVPQAENSTTFLGSVFEAALLKALLVSHVALNKLLSCFHVVP